MTFFLKTKVHLDSDKGISLKGHQKVNISDHKKKKSMKTNMYTKIKIIMII